MKNFENSSKYLELEIEEGRGVGFSDDVYFVQNGKTIDLPINIICEYDSPFKIYYNAYVPIQNEPIYMVSSYDDINMSSSISIIEIKNGKENLLFAVSPYEYEIEEEDYNKLINILDECNIPKIESVTNIIDKYERNKHYNISLGD